MRKLPKEIQEQVYVPERDGFVEDFELRKDDSPPPMEPTEVDVEI